MGTNSQISIIYRKVWIRHQSKIWGCIHKYLYVIEKCVFVPKENYLRTKIYSFLDRLIKSRSDLAGCSKNNHGLRPQLRWGIRLCLLSATT